MTTSLAAISLLTPLMLWGLAMAALPLTAHLLNRRSRRRLIFPSIRLLTETVAMQSHLFRLRRLLLLLLRCLAVALIVWAFARPQWFATADRAGDAGGGNGVVVVIDASVSTRYDAGGVRVFDRLRTAAQRALDDVAKGRDVAEIVVADARPHAAFGRLVANIDALQAEIEQLEPTWERADLYKTLDIAGRLLAEHDGPRHLIVASDLQRSNWEDVLASGSVHDLLPEGTTVTLAETDVSDRSNVALSAPRVAPQRPIVGHAAQTLVLVTNHADEAAAIDVDLQLDGTSAGSRRVTLGPREQHEVAFDVSFPDEAERELRFAVTSDALSADDEAFAVASPVHRLPVLVIADDDPDQPGSSSFFLVRALSPHGDASDHFEVRYSGSRAVDSATLRNAPVVFVGDTARLDEATATALGEHVDTGGGLVLLLGEGPVRDNLQTLENTSPDGTLLPWALGSPRYLVTGDPASRIIDGDWQSPLLRSFDHRSQFGLADVPFDRVWLVDEVHVDTQVLLSFGDGTPALGLRRIGDGTVALANFSPSVRVSGFGRYGSFVAIVQSLAEFLQSDGDVDRSVAVGHTGRIFAETETETTEPIRAHDPLETILEDVEIAISPEHVDVIVPRPRRSGIYRVRRGSETIGRLAVNVDARESDLAALDRDTLVSMLGGSDGHLTVTAAGEASVLIEHRGRPLWSWALMAALIVIGLELVILGVWGRP